MNCMQAKFDSLSSTFGKLTARVISDLQYNELVSSASNKVFIFNVGSTSFLNHVRHATADQATTLLWKIVVPAELVQKHQDLIRKELGFREE